MPRLAARQYDPLFHLAPRQDHTVCRPAWGSLDGLSSCGVQCERGAKGVRFKMRLSYCPIWTLVLLSIVNSCLASGPDLECAAHSRNSALSQGLFSAVEFVRQTWSLPDPHTVKLLNVRRSCHFTLLLFVDLRYLIYLPFTMACTADGRESPDSVQFVHLHFHPLYGNRTCPAGVTLPTGRHVDQRLLWPL